ncbi:11491_t:CDS:10 [Funneliformis caledonium]|uniref:11491_t:CDS:1 n=1 Tax=Funneliformis caledonium TaxID=1117310 RepID=A0A9N9CCZ4_9GLOM|nr:11491_t:CDS:10 [Funneliformis caledonium]
MNVVSETQLRDGKKEVKFNAVNETYVIWNSISIPDFGFGKIKLFLVVFLRIVNLQVISLGAMENWGLITYRTAKILLDPKYSNTITKYIAYMQLHIRWDHLWLKFFPDWGIWSQFDIISSALQLYSLNSAQPIELHVNDNSEISQVFDAISYYRGASVIRMQSSFLFMTGWTWMYPILTVKESTPETLVIRHRSFLSSGVINNDEDTAIWWVPLGVDFGQAFRVGFLEVSDRIGAIVYVGALTTSRFRETSNLLSFIKEFEEEDKYMTLTLNISGGANDPTQIRLFIKQNDESALHPKFVKDYRESKTTDQKLDALYGLGFNQREEKIRVSSV